MKIGEMLIQDGLISQEQLQEVLSRQKGEDKDKKIGEILIKRGYLDIETLMDYLDKQIDLI